MTTKTTTKTKTVTSTRQEVVVTVCVGPDNTCSKECSYLNKIPFTRWACPDDYGDYGGHGKGGSQYYGCSLFDVILRPSWDGWIEGGVRRCRSCSNSRHQYRKCSTPPVPEPPPEPVKTKRRVRNKRSSRLARLQAQEPKEPAGSKRMKADQHERRKPIGHFYGRVVTPLGGPKEPKRVKANTASFDIDGRQPIDGPGRDAFGRPIGSCSEADVRGRVRPNKGEDNVDAHGRLPGDYGYGDEWSG